MKVAIVTLNASDSFGNKMQNYALQETLKHVGCDVETLVISETDQIKVNDKLIAFSSKYINEKRIDFRNLTSVKNLNDSYDFFIVGSDQVWNGNFILVKAYLDVFFLKFASMKKRISYAASFGGTSVPCHLRPNYIIGLNEMAALSVREDAGMRIVEELCGKKADVHLDPTLLLDASQYQKLAAAHDKKPKGKYAVCNFIFALTDQQTQRISEFFVENNLQMVDLNALLLKNKIGIEEFIDYIMDAEYVLTDSFHCTVFSLIFHKKFISYICNIKDVGSRIESLFRILNLSDRAYTENKSLLEQISKDYPDISEIVEKEKKKSLNYLKKALCLPDSEGIDIVANGNECYGCGACKAICPVDCISMVANPEGFLYPQIDKKQCISCKKCEQVCPALNPAGKKDNRFALAVKNKNDQIRKKSTSGGVFTALYSQVIREGGVVFGAAYDERQKVIHCSAETLEDAEKFRGSKYVQSEMGNCFAEAKNFLEQGRKVLFSGTPCQIGALIGFLGRTYDNLITADLICHGVPSPLAWKKYIEYHEKLEGSSVVKANMRSKANSWSIPLLELAFANGKKLQNGMYEDPYYWDFLTDVNLRECCYNCGFKGFQRTGDLTLADFWGVNNLLPEMYDEKGVSLILVNSEKGEELLNTVKCQLEFQHVDPEKAVECNPSAVFPCQKNGKRSAYFARLEETKWYV